MEIVAYAVLIHLLHVVCRCSLEKHWRNIEKNAREYQFQFNGTKTDRRVTVKEVLKEAKWDADKAGAR